MFFKKDGEERLEIGQYGSENILYKVDEEEAEKFISIFSSSAVRNFYPKFGLIRKAQAPMQEEYSLSSRHRVATTA